MNRTLTLYNYDQCYARNTKRRISIRQTKLHSEVIVAKPMQLLAQMDNVEYASFDDVLLVLV